MYAMVRYDVIICYDMSTHEMTYPIYFYIDMYDRIMYTYVHNHVCQHFFFTHTTTYVWCLHKHMNEVKLHIAL